MTRCIPVLLCLLLSVSVATTASARPAEHPREGKHDNEIPYGDPIDGELKWPGGTTSDVEFRVTGEDSAVLTKDPDEASQMLRRARDTGKRFPRVVVTGRQRANYGMWELTDVRVSSYRVRSQSYLSGKERIALRYTRIKFKYSEKVREERTGTASH